MRRAGAVGRRWGWWLLVLAVLGLHAAALQILRARLISWEPTGMKRMQVSYTRQLQTTAAPLKAGRAALAAPKRVAGLGAAPAMPALAAPDPREPAPFTEPATPAALEPAALEPAASAPPGAALVASAVPLSPIAAASAPSFEWPLSTRIRYRLSGFYRGEISGVAQVEWLRQGERYQVHLDVDAGVVSRRMSSEGRITAVGLVPQRYEEVTQVLLAEPQVRRMRFESHEVVLANGEGVPYTAASGELQDTASQLIQVMYLFSTRAELQGPGQRLALQLALPRRVLPCVYEVAAMEWVEAPGGGWLATWPLRPKLPAQGGTTAGPDLRMELWLAPRLQMLPVRVRIRQDAETYLDLHIERLPEQALTSARP